MKTTEYQPVFRNSKVVALATLLAMAAAMISCATTPAKVKRVEKVDECNCDLPKLSLGDLLDYALEDQDSAASAHALAHFVEEWQLRRGGSDRAKISTSAGRSYAVRFNGTHEGLPLTYFDELSPAVDYRLQRLTHHRREGIGAPLVALRENNQRETIEKHYPPEAITRPITAVARKGGRTGDAQQVQIDLLCPLHNDDVSFDGETLPLAADFSVPWAALLERSGDLSRSRVTDFIDRKPKREPRLYLMEPYDPDKEPLIMIHGLLDTPLVWAQLSNELWADDEIRSRYQIWHYLYNTSAPALYSGRILRNQLRELRPLLDPSGKDAAMQSTTVIAHSMGGIVTRSLITQPGDAFWKAAFTQSFDSLELSETDRSSLRDAFFWEPERHVKRVVYIAASHRGSEFADNAIGRLGNWLAKPPNQFEAFYERISSANPGAFTPAYAELGAGKLNSVHALSPKQPTLKILADLPNSHGVREFSIIGDRGKSGPVEESSDGLVPYWSSHIDRAESEKIVPIGHYAMNHEASVAEIKRVLKLR